LLKTHEEVRRFEFARLRAVLVDEFQDTDPAQLELVSHLLRRPSDCKRDVLGFFVGDTKQSIYRFRGVDVVSVTQFSENYEDQVNSLKSKREFHLQTNFRSCAPVIDFANYFFRRNYDLVEDTDLLIPFRDDGGPPTQWIQLEGDSLSAEQIRELTAEATARIIHELAKPEESAFTYKDFLILTRSNRELDSLLAVLERAGIPVATSGARTYYQKHEVLDLLNLLIARYHPSDSVAVAALLRSPLIRLTDDEIHRLLARVAPERLFHSDDELPEFLAEDLNQRICEVRRLAGSRRETPLPEWLHDVQLFIPADAYTRPHDGEGRAIVRMSRLLKALRDETLSGNHPPLVWLLKQRNRAGSVDRWNEDSGEDVNLFDEGVDAV
ncbi:MAG: UvrD-helicase domain-containing protein, partial [bacterium]